MEDTDRFANGLHEYEAGSPTRVSGLQSLRVRVTQSAFLSNTALCLTWFCVCPTYS